MKWFLILLLWVLSSCNFSLNRSRQYSIVSPDEISNIPSDDFFYVNIKSAYYTGARGSVDPLDFMMYAMDEGPGTDCKIPISEESATEDLYCMFEISEGDLWFHEINLEYNVPPGMCSYLAFMPHWHYNQPTGYGPSTVYECDIRTGTSENGDPVTEKRYSLTPPGNNKTCNGGVKKEIKDLCYRYDRSNEEKTGLANCCIGTYSLIGEQSNSGEWSGDVEKCIGGLARTNWTVFDKNGFPGILIEQSGSEGLNKEYKLYPLVDKIEPNQRFSLPTANFFKAIEDDKETEDFPAFYNSINPKQGQPFITWACLDQYKEVKHAIKFIIREWNTQEEFIRFKETQGGSGDPDITGSEGSECDYYENNILNFGQCDDLIDIDAFESEKGVCNTACSAFNGACEPACETHKTACNTNCTAKKTSCLTGCGTADEPTCDTDCDEVKSTCDKGCTADKDTCYSGCETDCYNTSKEACAKPKEICYESCRIHKEYRDIHCFKREKCKENSEKKYKKCTDSCDYNENRCLTKFSSPDRLVSPGACIRTCKTACDSNRNTCNRDCTEVQDTCGEECNQAIQDAQDAQDKEQEECESDCNTKKNTCDNDCTNNKRTCEQDCSDDKERCNIVCDYPRITYK